MGEYLPLHQPGHAVTRKASAAITGGQLVAVTGDGTVGPTSAATAAFFGVAGHDAANGDDVTIHKGGVQRLVASGAIDDGDIVVAAAAGKVANNDTPGAGQQVGIALTTAADGETVEVDMVR